jgi:hypothetical protein
MPIQRIPRYRMLLEGLLKYTSRSSPEHPDLADLTTALKQMSDVAENLNGKIHERQNLYKLKLLSDHIHGIKDLIQPNRWFIRDYRLRYFDAQQSTYSDAVLFLFNDLLIHTNDAATLTSRGNKSSTPSDNEERDLIGIMDMAEIGDDVRYDTRNVFNLVDIHVHPLNYSSSPTGIGDFTDHLQQDEARYRNRTMLSFQIMDQRQTVYEYACHNEKDKSVVVSALSEAINDMMRRKRTFDNANHNNDRFQRISVYSFDLDAQQSTLVVDVNDLKPLSVGLGNSLMRRNKTPTSPRDVINPYL